MASARITALALLSLSAILPALGVMTAPAGCAGSPPCAINSDCVEGVCESGTCRIECADSARDCAPGYRCSSGQCLPEDGSGGSGGASTSSSSSSSSSSGSGGAPAASSSSSSSASSSASGGGAGGPGGDKLELDLCAADDECINALLCREMWKGGPKRCTRGCEAGPGCPSGMRCAAVGAEKFCAASDVGKACADGSACNFACIPGPAYCTAECSSGADCPNGFGCAFIGGVRVCVKAEALCSAGDTAACVVPAACDTQSPKLLLSGCTLACETAADCPQRASVLSPWTCDGLCRRPPDVLGPLAGGYAPAQYACNAAGQVVNLCNDAQHMNFEAFTIPPPPPVDCASPVTTDGQPGDACVDSCRYQGGCPFQFGCVAVGNASGARIGLCLPAGAGEVGAACKSDTECAFGYCSSGKCSRDCSADGVCPGGSVCTAVGGQAPVVEGVPFKRCQ